MTTNAILERVFDTPLSVDDVLAQARDGRWCFDIYKVDWHGSFLAADGRRMVCWFSAADLESARLALRKAGADLRRLWAGTVHDGPKPATPNVLVERSFVSPVRLEDVQALEDAAAWCLEAHNVTFARTLFSLDRRRMLCFYEAPDADSVRAAQRKAEMPLDAVWTFAAVTPPPIPR
jgi:hypothetical protein